MALRQLGPDYLKLGDKHRRLHRIAQMKKSLEGLPASPVIQPVIIDPLQEQDMYSEFETQSFGTVDSAMPFHRGTPLPSPVTSTVPSPLPIGDHFSLDGTDGVGTPHSDLILPAAERVHARLVVTPVPRKHG